MHTVVILFGTLILHLSVQRTTRTLRVALNAQVLIVPWPLRSTRSSAGNYGASGGERDRVAERASGKRSRALHELVRTYPDLAAFAVA